MQKYKLLQWDSDFFGFPVAIITEASLCNDELYIILAELVGDGVKLVYWPSSLDFCSKYAALCQKGLHVDRKLTFIMSAGEVKENKIDIDIDEYNEPMIYKLSLLAIQCGYYSRFNIDPNMSLQTGAKLYVEWMTQSINKNIADKVFVARIQNEIVGVITLGNKNGIGDIGLLSIDQSFRGKSIGTQLVYKAQKWFIDNGFKSLQVVTQGNNIGARRLYEKCGYRVGLEQEYYHFWL